MQQVFTSSHGCKSRIWEEVRTVLSGLRTKNNELLFPDGISSINTLRCRMTALMNWIKKYRDSAAIHSGTDDEVHSDFIALLENLLELESIGRRQGIERVSCPSVHGQTVPKEL